MPTLHRIGATAIRVNVPDHPPPHVHVVLKDRRDAQVMLDSFEVISTHLKASDIADALVWIKANRSEAIRVFKECNP